MADNSNKPDNRQGMNWQPIETAPDDYKVTSADAGGKGGQHVALQHSKVRVVHVPTGLAAECEARSQHRSRQICLEMITWGLAEL